MKKLMALTIATVTSLGGMVPVAQAATVAGNFNVTVSLTSVCTVGAPIADLAFGTYTAFQAGALVATPTTITLTCTRGTAALVTAQFDTGAPGSTAGPIVANPVGAGVLAGLQYTMAATQGAVVVGTPATAGTIGTADTRPYVISGSMPALQAGAASTGVQTQARTLTITY